MLHLLGYDHEKSEREARVMARREAELLGVPGMLEDAKGVGDLVRPPGTSKKPRSGVEEQAKAGRRRR